MECGTRAAAFARGDKWYTTGKPCKRGHTGKRRTSNYACIECNKEEQSTAEYKQYARNAAYKHRYGITIAEYNTMVAEQGGKCKLCDTTDPKSNKTHNRFHIDHDHNTGEVRGLLCVACNMALGLLHDDVELLGRAIKYVTREDT